MRYIIEDTYLTPPVFSPHSLVLDTNRNCRAACCPLQLGWSTGKSATDLSRPTSQQLRESRAMSSKWASPLKTYIFQRSRGGGSRASVGSTCFSTVPLTVFVSATRWCVRLRVG